MKDIAQFPDFIKTLPEVDLPLPGARGWMIQGEKQQVVFLEFDRDTEVPEHVHDEQWEFALAGRVVLTCNGEKTEHRAGDHFFIQAGVPHSGSVTGGYKAMLVFNSPDRYKKK